VTHWGQCKLWLGILPPERTITSIIPGQALAPGSKIRVTAGWDFVYSHRIPAGVSTTAPVSVP
jgi:hypothetical protein